MKAGDWLHNPVTGELGHLRVAPGETGGLRMEGDLWLQPGAAVMGEHMHSALVEVLEVVEGTVAYKLDGREGAAGPGETIVIPVGARHDWWNGAAGRAHVRFTLESADPATPMAARFLSMIETGWGLGAAGKTNEKGMPGPLWLAAVAHEYRDVLRFTRPPAAVRARSSGHWPPWRGALGATRSRRGCTATTVPRGYRPLARPSATRSCACARPPERPRARLRTR